MTSKWDKFLLLLWKNWIIQKRHYLQTLFEILIPALCCSMLILVRGLVDPEKVTKPLIFDLMEADVLSVTPFQIPPVISKIAYSPKNAILDDLLHDALKNHLRSVTDLTLEGYPDAQSLENLLAQQNYLAGVEFDKNLANITSLPDHINFALRFPGETRVGRWLFSNWRTNLLVVPFSPGARNPNMTDGGNPNYMYEGFIPLQVAISNAILAAKNPQFQRHSVFLSRIPYPPYYEDKLLPAMEQLLPLIILIAFFYTCINTVKHITIEKERQLKEAMKIMGLPNWLHWTAWFVRSLILLLITITLVTVLMTVSLTTNTELAVLEYSEWSVLWVFLLAFAIATICFCFMMSVFFNKANTAAGIAGLMWFLLMMPFNITVRNYDDMATGSKLALCLLSNTGMAFGVLNIVRLEGNQAGLQWSNLFVPSTMNDGLSVGLVIVMFIVDALIYLAIALYFEQIMPGEFGVAKPWYFLFKKEYWKSNKVEDVHQNGIEAPPMDSKFIEQDPPMKHAGVLIKRLRKVYGNKVAVEGLDLNMYEDQITVLLGHNGAGKTTTMSMLTGMFSPTSGTAFVNGHNIRTDIEGVRHSLGLCPQHNVLFNELTVAEHIKFFAKLKGVSGKLIDVEIKKYIDLLELKDKTNAQSRTLSGGMKRKLAVGVALCGGSKVVFLDEPSSGMDPSARRALWELLQKEKVGRTILLSTHFMDEADVLGDRIAIMAEGCLSAVGSPFFLKKAFGAGYRLICVKNENCDKIRLLSILSKYLPEVAIETDIGTELSVVLREDYLEQFQPMLEELESEIDACGISSYGISLTTMEEVFLRSGTDYKGFSSTTDRNIFIDSSTNEYALENLRLVTGKRLLMNQTIAQFMKKMLITFRSLITLSMQILIPVVFVLATYIMILNSNAGQDLPPLDVTLESYTRSVTVLQDLTGGDPVAKTYQRLHCQLGLNHELLTTQEEMNDFILQKSIESISTVNTRYWVAATINQSYSIAWFNNKAYHTAPLAINLLFNALLQSFCVNCSIGVTNNPLPYRLETRFEQLDTGANSGFQLAFNTGFAMAFVAALYIMFYIRERTTRAKLLQFVSGVNVFLFWAVSFVWDYLVFVVVSLFYLAAVAAIQQEGWSTFAQLVKVFLVLLLFGFAVIPTTYLFSYLFDVPATGFVKLMLLNVLTGTVFFTAVTLLKFEGIDLVDVANTLEWVFMLFPNFVLSHALNSLNRWASTEAFCSRQCESIPLCTEELMCQLVPQCCLEEIFTFGENGINRNLLFFIGIGLGAFGLIMLAEYRVVKRMLTFFRRNTVEHHDHDDSEIDSDVLAEKKRVHEMSQGEISSYNLVLKDVSKYYRKFRAVNKLSIGIRHSECFGLLGINGAGKTSTFKMMTGDENISAGEAWVNGVSLLREMNRVHRHIGYCPQFDALLEDLTGRETLRLFAMLRGVQNAEVNSVSLALAEELNFMKHFDKLTKAYSGGNKRKLSTALALMGDPAVVYLDEPTTGMDPGAKRQLWNVICKIREAGKAIVLTSHSMEECEALCSRLAIMVNGEFMCLGSTQHLKNKFSKGFLLTVKVKRDPFESLPERVDQVKQFVQSRFAGAVLQEGYQDSLSFHIPQSNLRWSTMFGLMQSSRERLEIEDYALGQTSLEQVFLYFTKYQRESK
ncbi:phospholipid-transporting ATPase ABCA3-like [Sabethes cyaneus]|uniref:phospholipid-transporting ATPase ABCA3-like n=1 Tax=Sabethes cyaneus TaxID=53552 RepID=UPI00237D8225|nr:phospholipid-transporting ATPase ABCA3-like [Sabethes cyaneus]XP_053689711.1 phospholipid-transporting ATPase ABCA3-like [Sabethes cyaneus]